MSPTQQRITIARECRWKIENEGGVWRCVNPAGVCVASDTDPSATAESFAHLLPDYLNDRNAIADAVKARLWPDPNLMNRFQNYELGRFVRKGHADWLCLRPADQWAEAFLHTLGLWVQPDWTGFWFESNFWFNWVRGPQDWESLRVLYPLEALLGARALPAECPDPIPRFGLSPRYSGNQTLGEFLRARCPGAIPEKEDA